MYERMMIATPVSERPRIDRLRHDRLVLERPVTDRLLAILLLAILGETMYRGYPVRLISARVFYVKE